MRTGSSQPFLSRLVGFRYLFLVYLVIAGVLGAAYAREYVRARSIRSEIATLQAQADTLQAHNLELSRLSETLRTESNIEREARLKLGMKKPGETVVVIQHPTSAVVTARAQDSSTSPGQHDIANPRKWWYYFFPYAN